jgi:carboxypeptidase PM20D1
MEGSKGMNVIPPKARMVANLRIIPGETCESALAYLRNVVKDNDVKVNMISGMNPSRTSVVEGESWDRLKLAIESTFEDVVVSPYLMFACSDSRHWGRISDKVYRFSPMTLTSEERATIHGNDERISKETVRKTVEFYIRLIKNS